MSAWQEHTLFINGPVGKLELLSNIDADFSAKAVAIICHPHPLYGGTMHNKVITTLARTYKELDIPSIRFNYRGVGQSEGTYDEGKGETADALAVIDWLMQHYPTINIYLAGFSFGSFVALSAANKLRAKQFTKLMHLTTIAPAVNHADFSSLQPPACPWLVVIAAKDDLVPAEQITTWAQSQDPKPELLTLPNASHFFDGELVSLRQQLIEKLTHAHTS